MYETTDTYILNGKELLITKLRPTKEANEAYFLCNHLLLQAAGASETSDHLDDAERLIFASVGAMISSENMDRLIEIFSKSATVELEGHPKALPLSDERAAKEVFEDYTDVLQFVAFCVSFNFKSVMGKITAAAKKTKERRQSK